MMTPGPELCASHGFALHQNICTTLAMCCSDRNYECQGLGAHTMNHRIAYSANNELEAKQVNPDILKLGLRLKLPSLHLHFQLRTQIRSCEFGCNQCNVPVLGSGVHSKCSARVSSSSHPVPHQSSSHHPSLPPAETSPRSCLWRQGQ